MRPPYLQQLKKLVLVLVQEPHELRVRAGEGVEDQGQSLRVRADHVPAGEGSGRWIFVSIGQIGTDFDSVSTLQGFKVSTYSPDHHELRIVPKSIQRPALLPALHTPSTGAAEQIQRGTGTGGSSRRRACACARGRGSGTAGRALHLGDVSRAEVLDGSVRVVERGPEGLGDLVPWEAHVHDLGDHALELRARREDGAGDGGRVGGGGGPASRECRRKREEMSE